MRVIGPEDAPASRLHQALAGPARGRHLTRAVAREVGGAVHFDAYGAVGEHDVKREEAAGRAVLQAVAQAQALQRARHLPMELRHLRTSRIDEYQTLDQELDVLGSGRMEINACDYLLPAHKGAHRG